MLDEIYTTKEFLEFIRILYREESKDRAYLLYCSVFPNLDKKLSFEEFAKIEKDDIVKKKQVEKIDILQDVRLILRGVRK